MLFHNEAKLPHALAQLSQARSVEAGLLPVATWMRTGAGPPAIIDTRS
jgi:hypothetical protein